MAFNLTTFKAEFRAKAAARGIDAAEGATDKQASAIAAELAVARHAEKQRVTTYQRVLQKAEIRRDLHYSEARRLVERAAERQYARGKFYSEGRGFLHDDLSLDQELLDKALSKYWWVYLSPDDWKPGLCVSSTEVMALAKIYAEVTLIHFLKKARKYGELEAA